MPRLFTSIIFCCSCLLAWWVGSRQDFALILVLFAIAFMAYYFLVFKEEEKLKSPWFWALAIRLPFLFVIPYLSDDFYRFIWDGLLQWEGLNPFLQTPIEVQEQFLHFDSLQLFDKLNSQEYYSVYPAFNQYFFAIATKLGGNSLAGQVLTLRVVILVGEFLVLYLLQKIGELVQKPKLFILYAFNPLVLLEFTGNLHFEVWVIAFVLAAYYAYESLGQKIVFPAILFGLAISTKLLPALFLPLIWKHLGLKRGFAFCVIAMLTFGISFVPYFNADILINMSKSIDLFFRSFEFNASVYYFMRWLGFQVVGYNWIGSVGLILKVLTLAFTLYVSILSKSFTKSALLIYLVYLLFSTTIHPWYILPIFTLSLFTNLRSIWYWTALVFLSYHAYRFETFQESIWVVGIEYGLLFGLIWSERHRILQFTWR